MCKYQVFPHTSIVTPDQKAQNEVGKISADRRTKSALTFTIPLRKQIVYEQCISSAERILFRAPALTAAAHRYTTTTSLNFIVSHQKQVTLLFSVDSDLEAFSHYPTSLALQHWLFNQPHYQMLEPSVPLVLSWITVTVLHHQ